jgi:anaphase-promoting complex subunit 10
MPQISLSPSNKDHSHHSAPSFPSHLEDVTLDGVWTLSSGKPGNGVEHLLDNSTETFWQSDGPQPHLLTIQFHRRMKLSELWIFAVFKQDESYTPQQIQIRMGDSSDFVDIQTVELREPEGWVRIPLCSYSDPNLGFNKHKQNNIIFRDKNYGGAIDYIRTHSLQVAILTNHQNGRDTHIRQVKLFGPNRKYDEQISIANQFQPKFPIKTLQCQLLTNLR